MHGVFERAEQGFALTHMNAWLQVRHLERVRARSEMVERGILAQAQLLQKTGAPPGSGGRRYPHYTMRHRTARHGQISFPKTFGARALPFAFGSLTYLTCICSRSPPVCLPRVISTEPDADAIVNSTTARGVERLFCGVQ